MASADCPAYDVAVIGMGPAGATLARLLHPRLSVAALDRDRGEHGFRKACGGLLADDAQKALARFGLTLPLRVMVDPQIFSVRTIDIPTGLVRHYQRFYLNMDRHRFDLWLKSLVPDSVDKLDGARCTGLTRSGGLWQVRYRIGGADRALRAKYVVGADGANSLVRGVLYPDAPIRTYLSIQQWFPDHHPTPFYSCIFDPAATDCYSWGLSKDGSFLLGGAFPRQNARARFELLKEKLRPHGFRLDNPLRTEACLVHRPAGLGQCKTGRDDAFLIGEAAGLVSPSSLEGISWAMNSAERLAQVLNSGALDPCARYRIDTTDLVLRLYGKHLKSPFMYHPLLRRMVMASGITSIPVAPESAREP